MVPPNAVSGALFPKVSSLDKDTANRITPQPCRQTLLVVVLAAVVFAAVGGWLLAGFMEKPTAQLSSHFYGCYLEWSA